MAQEATATSTGLPEGITKPPASINSQDQSGLIAILTAFSLGLVLLSIATRIYVRHELRLYRIDDFTFFVATVCMSSVCHVNALLIWVDFCNYSNLVGLQGTSRRTRESGRSSASVCRFNNSEGKRPHGHGFFNLQIALALTLRSLDSLPISSTSLSSSSQNAASRSFTYALPRDALTCV